MKSTCYLDEFGAYASWLKDPFPDCAKCRIYDLLENKVVEILEEVCPGSAGFVRNAKPMKRFKSRWRAYLSELDISFMGQEEAHTKWNEPGRIKVHNPLYCEDKNFLVIDMSIETADKILLLGMP